MPIASSIGCVVSSFMCCSRIAGLEAKRGYGAPRTVDKSIAGSGRAQCLMRTDAHRARHRAARDEAPGRGPKPLEARYGCALRQSRAVSLSYTHLTLPTI